MAEARQILAEADAPSFLDPKLHDAAHAVARVFTADAVGAAFMAA